MAQTRTQKTLEQKLEEARAKRQKATARLEQLEAQRKARDVRTRAKAEKALIRIVLDRVAANAEFRDQIQRAVADAALRADERQPILWLLEGLAPPSADAVPASSPALPAAEPENPLAAVLRAPAMHEADGSLTLHRP